MKTKAFVFNGFMNILKSRFAIVLFTVVLASPAISYGQSGNVETDQQEPEPATAEPNAPSTGPWRNSAGATVGATRPANPSVGSAGRTAGRPAAGATPDATGGPGGNPDVPFDASMNLMFLAGGVAFAYVIYRRRFKLKPATVEHQ